MTPEEQVIWAAGFFDGDGCINISCSKQRYYRFSLTTGQVTREPLELMQSIWGGSIYQYKRLGLGKLPFWQYVLTSQEAETALRAMLPYLIVKRRQALVALEFRETTTPGKRLTNEEVNRRDGLAARLREMKKHP